MDYVVGIDIGTTSTKAVLYDLDGQIMSESHCGYALNQPTVDVAEQEAEEIYQAVLKTLSECIKGSGIAAQHIRTIAFSAAMHSVLLLDDQMQPLTKVITWADNRAHQYAEEWRHSEKGLAIYRRTGTPIHPMSPFMKLLWIKNEHPDWLANTAMIVGIKEYVLYRLFGKDCMIDESIASATGMYNLNTRDWDEEVLSILGISVNQLPQIVSTTYQLKGLKPEVAQEIGVLPEMPVVIGASDGVLSNLGVDALHDEMALTIGTSAAVRQVVTEPVTDPKGRLFCYVLDDERWVLGGPVNNGGIVFQWVRDQLFTPEKHTAEQLHMNSYELLTEIASHIPAGSDGLIFLPFLGGERAPLWDANARGTFFGLTRKHTRDHLLRAALEGIVYNLYTVLLAMSELTAMPHHIKATGGFARSDVWKQLLADIFEMPVEIPTSFESSCLGAAVLGMKSLHLIQSIDEVKRMVGTTAVCEPNEDHFVVYRELMPIYIRLSRLLDGEYDAIAEYQRKYVK